MEIGTIERIRCFGTEQYMRACRTTTWKESYSVKIGIQGESKSKWGHRQI